DNFSLMLTTSRGKRSEHRVKKLDVKSVKVEERTPDELLAGFTNAASNAKTVAELDKSFKYTQHVLSAHPIQLEKATDIYGIRKVEMEEVPM
ncbi:hypothetical protein ACS77L_21960, partial [Yersinia enterocolitica]